jgi:hypothetical protein
MHDTINLVIFQVFNTNLDLNLDKNMKRKRNEILY